MYNIQSDYENNWLNMLDSVESHLKFQQQHSKVSPGKYKVYYRRNEWLNVGRSLDHVLSALSATKTFQQDSHDENLSPDRRKRLSVRFRTRSMILWQGIRRPKKCQHHQEGSREDHIMFTLARIHQRMKAYRDEVGIKNESILNADENLDIALRVILKRRNCH